MNKIVSALLVVVMIGAVVWSFAFGVPMYMVWQNLLEQNKIDKLQY